MTKNHWIGKVISLTTRAVDLFANMVKDFSGIQLWMHSFKKVGCMDAFHKNVAYKIMRFYYQNFKKKTTSRDIVPEYLTYFWDKRLHVLSIQLTVNRVSSNL